MNPFLFLAAKWGIGENNVNALFFADLRQLESKCVIRVYLWSIESVQKKIHLAKKIWKRLGFAAREASRLELFAISYRFHFFRKMIEGFD